MAIFKRLTKREIEQRFTHIGWFCGLCPIYIGEISSSAPFIEIRNGVPDWWFSVVVWLFDGFSLAAGLIVPNYEPAFPLVITGAIGKAGDPIGPL